MDRKVNTVIALMLVGAFPALSLYSAGLGPSFSADGARAMALVYLKGMPTYAFDGLTESVEVLKVEPLRMPYTWEVTVAFVSRHSGYGDRTGQMVLQVLTPHVARIVVSEGRVTVAVTDGVYNELSGEMLPTGDTTAEDVERIALLFLRHSPTFAFDGIDESVEVLDIVAMESYPVQYAVSIAFECRQAGYGDRTGQVLAQVITPHVVRVVVSAGEVRSAVIDGEWDELNQRDVDSGLVSPESARDAAIRYIVENYPGLDELPVSGEWAFTDFTPEGMLGASTYRYMGLGWNVTVRFMVVLEPVYTVTVEHSGDEEFTWEGTVEGSGVTELSTSLSREPVDILSPEQARDLAVEYVQAKYPELEGVEAPEEWKFTDLTPEGLLGYSTHRYTSGGWTVQVGFPVVWRPTYAVELSLVEPAFDWMGTVSQDETVTTIQ